MKVSDFVYWGIGILLVLVFVVAVAYGLLCRNPERRRRGPLHSSGPDAP